MSTYVIHPTVDQEKAVRAFLEALDVNFENISDPIEKLPDHVIKGIAEGKADAEAGRTISFDEFKKKLVMFK